MKAILLTLNACKCLLKSGRGMILVILAGITACFFAFQLLLGGTLWRVYDSYDDSYDSSIALDFSENGMTFDEANTLSDILAERLADTFPVQGSFCATFFDDSPTIFGFKNGGGNRWFVLDEGRYFNDEEVANAESKAIIASTSYPYADFDYAAHPFVAGKNTFEIVGLASIDSARILFLGRGELYEKLSPAAQLSAQHVGGNMYHDNDEAVLEHISYIDQAVIVPYTTYEKLQYAPAVVCLKFAVSRANTAENLVTALGQAFPSAHIWPRIDSQTRFTNAMNNGMVKAIIAVMIPVLYLSMLFVSISTRMEAWLRGAYACGYTLCKVRLTLCALWLIMLLLGYGLCMAIGACVEPGLACLKISLRLLPWMHAAVLGAVCIISIAGLLPGWTSRRLASLSASGGE